MNRYNIISITFIQDFANKKVGEVIECDCGLARDLVIAKNAKYTKIESEIAPQIEVIDKLKKGKKS